MSCHKNLDTSPRVFCGMTSHGKEETMWEATPGWWGGTLLISFVSPTCPDLLVYKSRCSGDTMMIQFVIIFPEFSRCHHILADVPWPGICGEGLVEAGVPWLQSNLSATHSTPQLQCLLAFPESNCLPVGICCSLDLRKGGRGLWVGSHMARSIPNDVRINVTQTRVLSVYTWLMRTTSENLGFTATFSNSCYKL